MPMMLSRMSGAAEEMSANLQKELPKTLIDEDGGAAGAEEAADEMFRRDTASKMMQGLSKARDQTLEKRLLMRSKLQSKNVRRSRKGLKAENGAR